MAYELLFTQLPERHGAGGGNVEGIDPVGHGDLDCVIAGSMVVWERPSPPCPAQWQASAPGQGFVINADRTVTQGHGSRLEAQGIQLSKPLFGPISRSFTDLRPGHLKYRAHTHAHGPAAERVTAGGLIRTASMFSAAALRKMAPTLVESTMPPARPPAGHSGQSSSTVRGFGR